LHQALDAFGDDAGAQRAGERENALDDRRAVSSRRLFTNELSIFSASTGRLCRWLSDE
jgi:hypothetical protein